MRRLVLTQLVVVLLLGSGAVAFAVGPPATEAEDDRGTDQVGVRLSPNKHIDHQPTVVKVEGRIGECALSPEEEFIASELRDRIRRVREREALAVTREASLETLHERIQRDLAALAVMQQSVTKELETLRLTEERLQRRIDDQSATAAGAMAAPSDSVEAVPTTPTEAARKQRIEQLAQILKKMPVEDAGRILENQTDDIAVAVLDALGNKQAGKILAKMTPKRAVALARGLVDLPVEAKPEAAP